MANIRPFCMPKWGIEMTEGTLAEWMVQEGEAFKKGQTLCLIETAKITNEVEAEFDAVLRRVLVPAGGDAQAVGVLPTTAMPTSMPSSPVSRPRIPRSRPRREAVLRLLLRRQHLHPLRPRRRLKPTARSARKH
jgi:Biotin-requiring enzyme